MSLESYSFLEPVYENRFMCFQIIEQSIFVIMIYYIGDQSLAKTDYMKKRKYLIVKLIF